MKPCLNPSICGVQHHHPGTICRASGQQSKQFAHSMPLHFGTISAVGSNRKLFDKIADMTPDQRMELLRRRWAEMGTPVNQTRMITGSSEAKGIEPMNQLVDAYLIVDPLCEDDEKWGEIDYRQTSLDDIVNGMEAGEGLWMDRVSGSRLVEIVGPNGPVYAVSTDGRHRAMVAAALRVKRYPAIVHPGDMLTPLNQDKFFWTGMGKPVAQHVYDNGYHRFGRSAMDKHLKRLVNAGYFNEDGRLIKSLDASWELEHPSVVAKISQEYAKRYSEHFPGNNPKFNAMMDETAWTNYLAPSKSVGDVIRSFASRLRGATRSS